MDKPEKKMVDKRVEDAKGNMQVDKQEKRMVDKQEERMVDKQKDKLVDKQEDKELTGWTRLMSAMNVEKTAVHQQEAAGRSKLSGKVGLKMETLKPLFAELRLSRKGWRTDGQESLSGWWKLSLKRFSFLFCLDFPTNLLQCSVLEK